MDDSLFHGEKNVRPGVCLHLEEESLEQQNIWKMILLLLDFGDWNADNDAENMKSLLSLLVR